MSDNLYFKQIKMGPMQNSVYLVGSKETGKLAVVDAAWDIEEILRIVTEKRTNPYLQFHSLRDFLAAMGYA